jgi:hypothetical protein
MNGIGNLLLRSVTAVPKVVSLWSRLPIGSVALRTQYGAWSRPQYAYGTFHAARQAKLLGLDGISVAELGVAGGDGLVALEAIAREVADFFGIQISVLGFDTGEGMPPASDYRDLPYVWSKGFYKMDQVKLRNRLKPNTQLVIGNIGETVRTFSNTPYPLGFLAFDMDYYTSTKRALAAFDLPQSTRLPRVYCYFDDIVYPEFACHNPWTGELRAIREFNDEHPDLKISPVHLLRWLRPHPQAWNDQMYVVHDFHHPRYCVNIMK